VTHGHPVPVRRQIAAGLACAILDGLMTVGEVLPSTRQLAGMLGVHRNTVAGAYRELRDRGLIAGVTGNAPRVTDAKLAAGPPGTIHLLRELANRALEAGVRRTELMAQLDEWRTGSRPPELLLIEPRRGLRRVLGAELKMRACRCLEVTEWRAIRRRSSGKHGTVVVARSEIARRAATKLPEMSEIFPLALVGGSAALARATRVRLPGVVALLTRSPEIRTFARDLAAGHHATGLSLATPHPGDTMAVRRAARVARLILVDASCWGMSFETRAPVRELRIVSDRTVRALRRYLGG
jgi:DNA-binding transcriptional regulator YhcF (GntR family)